VSWPIVVAVVVGILVGGLILLVYLVRERRSSSVRFGIFVERDLDDDED
jgi:hypothetical protein